MKVKIEQNEIIDDAFETAIDKLVDLQNERTIPEWKVYHVDNIEKVNNTYKKYIVDLHNISDMSDDPVYRVIIEIYGEEDNETVEIHLGE